MLYREMIEILENELKCMKAAETCNRECQYCQLVRDSDDVIEAHEMALNYLKGVKNVDMAKY